MEEGNEEGMNKNRRHHHRTQDFIYARRSAVEFVCASPVE